MLSDAMLKLIEQQRRMARMSHLNRATTTAAIEVRKLVESQRARYSSLQNLWDTTVKPNQQIMQMQKAVQPISNAFLDFMETQRQMLSIGNNSTIGLGTQLAAMNFEGSYSSDICEFLVHQNQLENVKRNLVNSLNISTRDVSAFLKNGFVSTLNIQHSTSTVAEALIGIKSGLVNKFYETQKRVADFQGIGSSLKNDFLGFLDSNLKMIEFLKSVSIDDLPDEFHEEECEEFENTDFIIDAETSFDLLGIDKKKLTIRKWKKVGPFATVCLMLTLPLCNLAKSIESGDLSLVPEVLTQIGTVIAIFYKWPELLDK